MNNYQQYEKEKQALIAKNLSPVEYEKQLKIIIDRLGI